jgi:single-strand DNA-binding protein
MNVVHLLGRLGADPELKYSASGNGVVRLRVATNRRVKEDDEWKDVADWHTVVGFGRQAEVMGEHLSKGDQLLVMGRLQTRKWQGQDGQDRYSTEVVAERFEFVGSKQEKPTGFRQKPQAEDFSDNDVPF